MKRACLTTLLCLAMLSQWSAAAAPDPALRLWLPLDEGAGTLATDRSASQLEAELTNVQWAKGDFGTAAYFTGDQAFADLPPVPDLNGAQQCTISLWTVWEGTGRYPNLLTTRTWSPGGLMLFVNNDACAFRLGRPDQRAGASGSSWTETSVPLLRKLPLQQWTHVCAVFVLPQITTYVNGKAVGQGKWDYPIQADGLRIGAWSNRVSHKGLISDVRIYSRALTPAEVATLAQDSARTSAAYTLLDESKTPPALAATFATDHAALAIDVRGRAVSLRSKLSGRELLERPQEMLSARLQNGRTIVARKASLQGDELTFEFSHRQGAAALAVKAHKDFLTFTVRSLTVPEVESLTFCNLAVAATKYRGAMANMLSDDEDAVCLRGYDLPVEMALGGNPVALRVSTTAAHGVTGWRAGLAAGPKPQMPAMLRAMAADAGVPLSKLGGPWSLGAETNRGSYLFADLSHASVDDWIDLARRGGFTHIHLHGWWETLGHYDVKKALFPNGLQDMQDAVARIHAAGLKAGIHTLTACISPRDPWVTPEPSAHLLADATYTLARPLTPTDTVIYVREKPSDRHDVIFSYSGNGNAIRIGGEIIQYAEISRELPFAFAKCQRGAFKTRPASHAEGDRADYLQQRYIAFYPQPGSPLADDLADHIAAVFNTCRIDQIYFDGSEGMRSRYGIDFMRHAIFKRLQGEVLVEASCHGAHNWWFHSRIGAWDHPVWAAKRFHDLHIASAARSRVTDLLEPQLGWWAPRRPSPQARGHFLDEMEYFAAKNLGLGAAMSIQGVNVSRQPLDFHTLKQITALGWYERLRLARYFDAATIARVAVPGDDFRLRQAPDGRWQFTPVRMTAHRVSGLDNGSESWTSDHPFAQQPLAARIEALYSVAPYDSPQTVTEQRPKETQKPSHAKVGSTSACISDFADLATFRSTTSSAAISLELQAAPGDSPTGGRNLCLRAANKSDSRRGAWARARLAFPAPYRDLAGAGAVGLWVKGDGKGALLNIQLGTPREYSAALSDHYVTLDFTGWRYVELLFRERDVERMNDYQWPYATGYSLYRNRLDTAHISELNLYLNDLPAGETEVLLSPIRALAVQPTELKNPALNLNGRTLVIPLTLKSGQFLELEPSGQCLHYDEKGDRLAILRPVPLADWPALQSGQNRVSFACDKPPAGSARAEVTLISSDAPFGESNPHTQIGWDCLAREYEMPRLITAAEGERHAWDLFVRPEEQARLEIELAGTLDTPLLTINDQDLRFPVAIQAGQKLVCRADRHWVVTDSTRAVLSQGDLPQAPPALKSGSNRIVLTGPVSDRATVKLIKVYQSVQPASPAGK